GFWGVGSIINGLGDFGEEKGFCYLKNGELIKVPMRKAGNKVSFPQPIGEVSTMLLYAEEIMRLARHYSIANARVFGANIGPRATFICIIAKILRLYKSPRLIDWAAKWLVGASQRDMRKLAPAYGVQTDITYDCGTLVRGKLAM
ncbi:MAG: hypothetical protein MK185_17690, partial [Saccharospirillaceae bacterium]|nr:hypothetical protein [Saccharospirillaceae bacterium]